MKKCPFCAEEIQDEAIKCRHCGEFLDGRIPHTQPEAHIPWYFRKSTLIVAILTVGPFALPLVWFHPKYSLNKKIVITVIVGIIGYVLGVMTAKAMHTLMQYYNGVLGSI